MFEDYSYVTLWWSTLTISSAGFALCMALSGGFWDVKQQMRPVGDSTGWFSFRKRTGLIYFISTVLSLWTLWNITSVYYFGGSAGGYFQQFYDFIISPKRSGLVDGTSVFIATVTWLLARLYNYHISLNVSVFSRRQSYNIIMAAIMYISVVFGPFSIVAEAEEFKLKEDMFSFSSFRNGHLVGVALVLFCCKIHGDSHKALTKLRKNRFGHITTTDYKLPKGGWFDTVSCPHYFAEIMTFVGMGVILGCDATTWWLITAMVAVSQFFLALNTHRFYVQKFEDYPKDKKMLIPFLL